jgi:hypothetical protein
VRHHHHNHHHYSLVIASVALLNYIGVGFERDGLVEREPGDVVLDELVRHVRLNSRVVRRVLTVQVYHEEHVLPQVVLLFNVVHVAIRRVFVELIKLVSNI